MVVSLGQEQPLSLCRRMIIPCTYFRLEGTVKISVGGVEQSLSLCRESDDIRGEREQLKSQVAVRLGHGWYKLLFRESDDIPFQVREDSYNLRRCGQG
jgi:hypothetical protein